MAVKKPLRRKRTRGRRSAAAGFVKAFRSHRWTGTSGVSVAVAFAVLVAVVMFAYSASPPAAQTDEQPAAPAEQKRPSPLGEAAGPPALARKQPAPAPSAPSTPAEEREAASDVTTGPMPPVVTLTGCLARSDKEFRLNDTTGANAPKSRSWKSGFLAKRPASVSIVPASNELGLSKHVGERVTVSGTLVDRELRVRTLRRVSSSCDDSRSPDRVTA
jgi:hypothetical protein